MKQFIANLLYQHICVAFFYLSRRCLNFVVKEGRLPRLFTHCTACALCKPPQSITTNQTMKL